MSQAKNGDTVKVHYTGRLENRGVFHSSRESQPVATSIYSLQIRMKIPSP
jgi:FKBP-type peptidyl-prolyl cis-trans isomerase